MHRRRQRLVAGRGIVLEQVQQANVDGVKRYFFHISNNYESNFHGQLSMQ